jgi:hypothetical protein
MLVDYKMEEFATMFIQLTELDPSLLFDDLELNQSLDKNDNESVSSYRSIKNPF